jgi:hypothetical protein
MVSLESSGTSNPLIRLYAKPVGWEGIVVPAKQERRPGREGRAQKMEPAGSQPPSKRRTKARQPSPSSPPWVEFS